MKTLNKIYRIAKKLATIENIESISFPFEGSIVTVKFGLSDSSSREIYDAAPDIINSKPLEEIEKLSKEERDKLLFYSST